MRGHKAAARRAAFVLVVALFSCSAPTTYAQCALARITSQPKICGATSESENKLLPEDGYLSARSYTSVFFGFTIDLPITSDGHRITIPVMLEKQHALLAIGFERENHYGIFTITAEESPPELERYEDEQQCNDSVDSGTRVRRPIPGGMLRYGSFYANIRHSGKHQTQHYWTRIRNYIIRIAVDSNDKDFLQRSKRVVLEAQFFCARNGRLTTEEGKALTPRGEPYQGPTVPTLLAGHAITDQPGLHIPPGVVSEGVYRNPDLGLQYELPDGWDVLPEEVGGDPPKEERQLREYELLHACSRTLLRAMQPGPGDAPEQNPRPLIVLRALDPTCLSIPTPASVEDQKIADEMSAHLDFVAEFGEIKSNELAFLGGRVFVVLHGIIGWRAPGEALSSRMSEALFVTQHHNLLLMWSLMAPSASELDAMPVTSITFDDSPPIKLPPLREPH